MEDDTSVVVPQPEHVIFISITFLARTGNGSPSKSKIHFVNATAL
jgi:hypothetical protein